MDKIYETTACKMLDLGTCKIVLLAQREANEPSLGLTVLTAWAWHEEEPRRLPEPGGRRALVGNELPS